MSNFPDMQSTQLPPTDQGVMAPDASASVWPAWFGGFAIGISALMLLGTCCGTIGIFATPMLGRMGGMDFPPMPNEMKVIFIIDMIISLILGIMMLMGGIGLIRRRAKGRTMLVRYAVARLVVAIPLLIGGWYALKPSGVWNADMMRAQIAFMQKTNPKAQIPASMEEQSRNTEPTMLQKGMTFGGAALGLVFPIIILLFLTRPEYKDEASRWET